jgi:hypothetical protein
VESMEFKMGSAGKRGFLVSDISLFLIFDE